MRQDRTFQWRSFSRKGNKLPDGCHGDGEPGKHRQPGHYFGLDMVMPLAFGCLAMT
jgi:hypothetical protein